MLTNYNGTAITYDAIGNPTKWRNAVSLTWEGRELQRADLAVNVYVNYAYNSDGIRTSKSYTNALSGETRNHTYVLDGTRILSEKVIGSLSYTLYYLYDESGDVQGFIYNNAYYYYQKNLQGDVVRILNSTGNIVVEYTYDAWGKVLTISGSMASTLGQYNPFRYRSYYYDREMGFYYLQSRYYDPTVGRFINADSYVSTGQGIVGYNMFAYCGNNPVNREDAAGGFWDTVFDLLSLGASVVDVFTDPTDGWAWAGLGGDLIDLLPFVTGVGEGTKALGVANKVDNAHDAAKGGAKAAKSGDAYADIRNVYGSIKDAPNYPKGFYRNKKRNNSE